MLHAVAAAEAEHNFFSNVGFGIFAFSIFILLGVVTWSYRDVANRHDHKSGNSNSHH
ncbi:MAG: hypothetical protein RLZ88_646 [Actinomycetota bacterium]|jgi:hypothetical protein